MKSKTLKAMCIAVALAGAVGLQGCFQEDCYVPPGYATTPVYIDRGAPRMIVHRDRDDRDAHRDRGHYPDYHRKWGATDHQDRVASNHQHGTARD